MPSQTRETPGPGACIVPLPSIQHCPRRTMRDQIRHVDASGIDWPVDFRPSSGGEINGPGACISR